MRYLVIALLTVFNPVLSYAQRDVLWADGGMSLARLNPGTSATYNYNVTRFLGLGAGAQIYDFHATRANFQPVPALFWDVRFNLRSRKKNQYLLFADAGINVYKRNSDYWQKGSKRYAVADDNGSYIGLGLGYFRSQTARGWGRYVTLKMISNSYTANTYDFSTGARGTERWGGGTLVVSFGYKF